MKLRKLLGFAMIGASLMTAPAILAGCGDEEEDDSGTTDDSGEETDDSGDDSGAA